MRVASLLLLLLIAMCAVIFASAIITIPGGEHVANHPDYPTMARTVGGPDPDPLQVAGGIFGVLQVGVFVCCIALGIRQGAPGRVGRLLGVGTVLYLSAMILMVTAHMHYGGDPDAPLWWGFPRATAVMVYLVWPIPLWFVALYVWKFDDWVASPDIEKHMRELAATRREAEDAR